MIVAIATVGATRRRQRPRADDPVGDRPQHRHPRRGARRDHPGRGDRHPRRPDPRGHPAVALARPRLGGGDVITFDRVVKRYGTSVAVDHLSLEIKSGETVILVGPSGCGKTTSLKMINRLIEPTEGTISIDDRDTRTYDVNDLRRSIGYVIQQVGLFPHQTVAENIATVPRLLGWTKQRIAGAGGGAARPDRAAGGRLRAAAAVGVERRRAPARRRRPRARGGSRTSCSWTSRSAPSIRSPGIASRTSCSASRAWCARRSSSSPTTSTRRSSSATAWPCFSKGGVLEQFATPEELLAHPQSDVRHRIPRRGAAGAPPRAHPASARLQLTALNGAHARRRPWTPAGRSATHSTRCSARPTGASASSSGDQTLGVVDADVIRAASHEGALDATSARSGCATCDRSRCRSGSRSGFSCRSASTRR